MTVECSQYGSINSGVHTISTVQGEVTIEVDSAKLPTKPYRLPNYPCVMATLLRNYQEHYVNKVPLDKGSIVKPNTPMDNECPGCGGCIKWEIVSGQEQAVDDQESAVSIKCCRFGDLTPGAYQFDVEAGGDFGKLDVHMSAKDAEEPYRKSAPTKDPKQCNVGIAANKLLKDIKNGSWRYSNTAWIGSTGYCGGCAEVVSFSVGAKRVRNIIPEQTDTNSS